jgi:hypothetical protein
MLTKKQIDEMLATYQEAHKLLVSAGGIFRDNLGKLAAAGYVLQPRARQLSHDNSQLINDLMSVRRLVGELEPAKDRPTNQ